MSIKRIEAAIENNEGYCKSCKKWTADCVEPDAREYPCPICHKHTVMGAEEILLELI
jgi:Zn finger protein HypA/HybF involved in hydrogenase expression